MPDEPRVASDLAGQEDNTPLQGVSLPKDAQKAGELLQSLTQQMKSPPLWVVKWGRGVWRPEGVRPRPQCALVIIEGEFWKQGIVRLIYHDKTEVLIRLDEMHCGEIITTHDVEQQYRLVESGHRDLLGRKKP